MYEEIATNFDMQEVINFMNDLLDKHPLDPNRHDICLTHTVNSVDKYYEGCGSLWYSGNLMDDTFIKHEPPLEEKSFNIVNEELSGTYFDVLYKKWSSICNVSRIRLIKLNPKQCLTWHTDVCKRIHCPIITDERCKFVIGDNAFHLPANGNSYLIDTTVPHSVFNGTANVNRIHLVGSIL